MSLHVLSWVLKHSEARLGDRLVLIALADQARGDDGTKIWPSISTITRDTRMSERAVHYSLKRLVEAGLITIEECASPLGTNAYTIIMAGATDEEVQLRLFEDELADLDAEPSSIPPDTRRTALYRIYSADDTLLYLGITGNPDQRFRQHGHTAQWWADVKYVEVEWHPSRRTALDTERQAINDENPLHNRLRLPCPK